MGKWNIARAFDHNFAPGALVTLTKQMYVPISDVGTIGLVLGPSESPYDCTVWNSKKQVVEPWVKDNIKVIR